MKRHFVIVAGVSALCMALAPTMAFGTQRVRRSLDVRQTNSAPADATAGNANTSGQLIEQSGGGSQSAGETAVNTQVIPIAAAPVMHGPDAAGLPQPARADRLAGRRRPRQAVHSAPAMAEATNVNASRQLIEQSGGGGGERRRTASPARPPARPPLTPSDPDRGRSGDPVQTLPINANVPVRYRLAGRRRLRQAVQQGARGRGREQRQRLSPGDLAGARGRRATAGPAPAARSRPDQRPSTRSCCRSGSLRRPRCRRCRPTSTRRSGSSTSCRGCR